MGLGRGNDALHVQLDYYHVGLHFYYCFQDLLNQGGGPQRPTYLQFIDEDIQDDPSTFHETTFQVPSGSRYYIRLINIKIGDTPVPMVPLDRVVTDSGSSITHLLKPVYEPLARTLFSWLTSKGISPRILQPTGLTDDPTVCNDKRPSKGYNILPSIHLILESGGYFEIKQEQDFIVWTDDPMGNEKYFCLMIEPHDTLSIIGAFQQVNHRVMYDTEQNKLLFKNGDCGNSEA